MEPDIQMPEPSAKDDGTGGLATQVRDVRQSVQLP
jgi:hypothetical protein